jgi:cation-transporting P-type ATPase C
MVKSSPLRVALGEGTISIWSDEIFGGPETSRVRAFLVRAFGMGEVEDIELERASSFGRVRYSPVPDLASFWQRLSRALRTGATEARAAGERRDEPGAIDAGAVDLDAVGKAGAGTHAIRIHRIGRVLSTWRLLHESDTALRLTHPLLRNRRDVAFRVEEEIRALLGVREVRANHLTGRVAIRFERPGTNAERVAVALEKAWPRLLEGLEGPPSRTRLFVSAGLVGLAYTGQFVVPALQPVAVASVALYSSPNLVAAARGLARGEIGLPVLYSTSLTYMLMTGMPFASAVMAVFTQAWPQLTYRKLVTMQRRLFSRQRRRPLAAVAVRDGGEYEVAADNLVKGDVIVVQKGETVPADGVVEDGAASIAPPAFDRTELDDRAPGDAIAAGTVVVDGRLRIRVERPWAQSPAHFVNSLLPHSKIAGLPASTEAERVAARNVKPALAASALALALTGTVAPAQAVIRPDYATAPRLSAQLTALGSIAKGFRRGILFRNPAALDRLASITTYAIDASAGLERRLLQVVKVEAVRDVSPDAVVGYALAAHWQTRGERSGALDAFAIKRGAAVMSIPRLAYRSGVTRFQDATGKTIEIAGPGYLAASKLQVPERFHTVLARRNAEQRLRPESGRAEEARMLRPIWVIRDGAVIGTVSFARTGGVVGKEVVAALALLHPQARVVYVAPAADGPAHAFARSLGIEFSSETPGIELGGSVQRENRVLWIGDGSAPGARDAMAGTAVSLSVAPLPRIRDDVADILAPARGHESVRDVVVIGRSHAAAIADDYRTVYTLNLLGAAGALFGGLTSLPVGLISNFGTGIAYARHALALNRLPAAV